MNIFRLLQRLQLQDSVKEGVEPVKAKFSAGGMIEAWFLWLVADFTVAFHGDRSVLAPSIQVWQGCVRYYPSIKNVVERLKVVSKHGLWKSMYSVRMTCCMVESVKLRVGREVFPAPERNLGNPRGKFKKVFGSIELRFYLRITSR